MVVRDILSLRALKEGATFREPFPAVIAYNLIKKEALDRIKKDFPEAPYTGLYLLSDLNPGPGFQELVAALLSPEFSGALGETLGVDLSDHPAFVTVRSTCRLNDGIIHKDKGEDKLATLLLYLGGETWEHEGGRLRLVRSPDDIESHFAEAAPTDGTLISFRCTENAWHGHKAYAGDRRYVMIFWLKDKNATSFTY